MSTVSTTGPESRSPSPLTPEPSDSLEPIAIQSDLDFTSSWFHNMQSAKPPISTWPQGPSIYAAPQKVEEEQMLRLDELIEQHAYDDSPSPNYPPSLTYSSPPSNMGTNGNPSPLPEPIGNDFRPSNLLVPARQGPISVTKPIPPPASLLRKPDPSSINQRVVYPPKESCNNLPILFPSIPEGGTKSRVETQVRVTIDLTDGSSSDPYKYDRVGSWKWIRLPQGTATKRRTRKQGKIDPDPEDILHLSTTVTCASPPHNHVLSCTSCQAREAKRVAKKLAARVRPARSDSESEGDGIGKPSKKHQEDTTSIIQFNCAEVLDFSTGSAVLPLRITCYCRHHREKVGFNVHFTMLDSTGRIVGSGMSRPIMITDDHKTSTASRSTDLSGSFTPIEHHDWSQVSGMVAEPSPPADSRAPSRRKKEFISSSKKRAKPYDAPAKFNRLSPEGTISSAPSPSTAYSPLPTTRASTPSSSLHNAMASEPPPPSNIPPLHHGMNGSETSSPDTLATPLDHSSDVPMPETNYMITEPHTEPPHHPSGTLPPSNMLISALPHPMSFMYFDPTRAQQPLQLQVPIIHRLIPNTGPTHGGIEVTILGANFHPTIQLNCVFGDVAASSTQRWSDNTLVCVLPPRAIPGVVAVWFEGFPKTDDQNTSLFTYSDESDRALMELALQVVGLKMTGKIEDAKNVAMRIVGNAGCDGSTSQNNGTNNMMQLAASSTPRDFRALLFTGPGEGRDFESLIVDFLAIIDTPLEDRAPRSISVTEAISHPSPSGQTLLHLAALLKLPSLTAFLVKHGADLDARDRNGFTPLHFASLSQSSDCAKILLEAGADVEIVNSLGKTAQEISEDGFFDELLPLTIEVESTDGWSGDEDGDLGDAEEESDTQLRKILTRRITRRTSRANLYHSGRATPKRSVDISRAATPPPPAPLAIDDKARETDLKSKEAVDGVDAKQAASFMEKMFQRTFAQLPAQGIIPNMPQLPLPGLPHLPNLPGLPAVPWGALPQVPMVFPVFVPMGWPSFLDRTGEAGPKEGDADEDTRNMGAFALRAAQEWRATWEKWVAMAVATTAGQQKEEEMPPPVYTPRATDTDARVPSTDPDIAEPVASTSRVAEIRPVRYDAAPVPEQEVDSFAYRPPANQRQKLQKKHDRMLLWFWLPILLLSMMWALHNGVRLVFQAIRAVLPPRTAGIRA